MSASNDMKNKMSALLGSTKPQEPKRPRNEVYKDSTYQEANISTEHDDNKSSGQDLKNPRSQEIKKSRAKGIKSSSSQEVKKSLGNISEMPSVDCADSAQSKKVSRGSINQAVKESRVVDSGGIVRKAVNITVRVDYYKAIRRLAIDKGVQAWHLIDEALGNYLKSEKVL